VVIFDENVSFDHYFGTYPQAANTDGNPFHALPGTPSVNGLTPALLAHNPNSANPQRLTPAQALTCDQNHAYTAEQVALDGGLLDKFVQATGRSTCSAPNYSAPGLVMDYYDGNTVTGLWNYAQRYAMSDNFYGTVSGPSTPGALNLIAGQTADGTGTNIGDMLNAKGITWGWFQGGFAPTGTTASGGPVCGSSHTNIGA
jgi:phospholipase C